jgi:hypothetical protein
MKYELDNFQRNTPCEEFIEDIRAVAKKLNKNSLTTREYDKYGKFRSRTIFRRFDSWLQVLELAGLEKSTKNGTTIEDLYENLEEVWQKLGRQPRFREMEKPLSRYGIKAYILKFGSWRNALESFIKFVNQLPENKTEVIKVKKQASSLVEKLHKTKREISWRMRFVVMQRDNFKCQICGRSPATNVGVILHIDHIYPWSKGGETVIENLQTLCSQCNIGKSNL